MPVHTLSLLDRTLDPNTGRAVTTTFGVPGLKAALTLAGFQGGDPRPPLMPLTPEAVERIRTLLHAAHSFSHV